MQITVMLQIERYVSHSLRDWDDMFTECVGYTSLVKDIGILAGKVAHDDMGFKNQGENVLDNN
jgi:hypothetical protein